MADIPHVDEMRPWNGKSGFSFSFPIIEIRMPPRQDMDGLETGSGLVNRLINIPGPAEFRGL